MRFMKEARRVLLFRLGSLGDTAAILPCFHLIARTFPDAARFVLTNVQTNVKASTIESVLGESGLVHGAMEYPLDGMRTVASLLKLRKRIRAFNPDVLVYMLEQRHTRNAVLRDLAFFKACAIPRIVGAPLRRDLFDHRWLPSEQRYENQVERLARCLAPLGDARLTDPASWDVQLDADERARAAAMVADIPAGSSVIACCPGTKIDVKDWGEKHWIALFALLQRTHDDNAIIFIGSLDEHDRSERLRAAWPGPSVNLCGLTTPREAAAAIARCTVYLGHDTGPMHIAAAAGLPCVAIFSARNKAGEWYPYGSHHHVLYHKTPCFDCRLDICSEHEKQCILSITPDEVARAFREAMSQLA